MGNLNNVFDYLYKYSLFLGLNIWKTLNSLANTSSSSCKENKIFNVMFSAILSEQCLCQLCLLQQISLDLGLPTHYYNWSQAHRDQFTWWKWPLWRVDSLMSLSYLPQAPPPKSLSISQPKPIRYLEAYPLLCKQPAISLFHIHIPEKTLSEQFFC